MTRPRGASRVRSVGNASAGNGGPIGWEVDASQSRAALSTLPVRIRRPSGLKAADRKLSRCVMGGPIGRQRAASQRRSSFDAKVSGAGPSRLNSTARTGP